MKEVIVVASGYFDPIHSGHIEKLGDKLIVIINNDKQTKLKKGFIFMPYEEREKIVKSLKFVDEVIKSIDSDPSVSKTLAMIKPNIFAKGGDRFSYEIPESKVCKEFGIKIIDGLGNKIQSSSELVKKAKENGIK